jgi:hypothetical protein
MVGPIMHHMLRRAISRSNYIAPQNARTADAAAASRRTGWPIAAASP